MKITAYMNLQPEHISLDLGTGTVKLDASARRAWDVGVYPAREAAAAALQKSYDTYAVSAELPDGSVFMVRGAVDQTEGRGGSYVAGLFDNYPAAYSAAAGLGVQGQPGDVTVRPAPENVFSTVEDWKVAFDARAARSASSLDSIHLRQIMELDADDAKAIGAADPEYIVWLKLNEKFAPKAGATS